MNMAEWFIPSIEEFQSERALLHLGLNSALRHYRELVVPGIGGVWFVRQLSWSVAGLTLAREYSIKPAKVANAIEALACKLEWRNDPDNYDKKGKRAFSRDSENSIWSFSDLSDKTHYVQVTYRQSTVRALTGLKLGDGTRFNAMQLTESKGQNLAKAFFEQPKIYNALTGWINGDNIKRTDTITLGLASAASAGEKEIVRNILRADSGDNIGDPLRRSRLIDAFGRNKVNIPDLDAIKKNILLDTTDAAQKQVDDINTAHAFDRMLESGRQIVHICAQLISEDAAPISDKLVKNKTLSNALDQLYKAAREFQSAKGNKHPDALKFTSDILSVTEDKASCLKKVISRDTNILDISGEKIIEGHLFDRRREAAAPDEESQERVGSEESSTENKIRQLFDLWGDCQ